MADFSDAWKAIHDPADWLVSEVTNRDGKTAESIRAAADGEIARLAITALVVFLAARWYDRNRR